MYYKIQSKQILHTKIINNNYINFLILLVTKQVEDQCNVGDILKIYFHHLHLSQY